VGQEEEGGYTRRIHPKDTNSMVMSGLNFTKALVGSGMGHFSPPMHDRGLENSPLTM